MYLCATGNTKCYALYHPPSLCCLFLTGICWLYFRYFREKLMVECHHCHSTVTMPFKSSMISISNNSSLFAHKNKKKKQELLSHLPFSKNNLKKNV